MMENMSGGKKNNKKEEKLDKIGGWGGSIKWSNDN
jgi:hypothetical protein